jgi:hypothetical protein
MLLVQLGINSTRDVWKFAKLDSPRRLVQFWQNFQTSLVLLIPNCTRHRMITYTNCVYPNPSCQLSLWEETGAPGENPQLSAALTESFHMSP